MPGQTILRLSVWGSANEKATYQSLVKTFERQHPTIHVDLLHIPENYFQKIHILMAGGLAPDVMMMNSLYLPVYADNGMLMPLESQANQTTGLKGFFPNALQALTWKQHLYAVPRDVSDVVVYINRDLLKRANVPMPLASWTMADYGRLAQRLTAVNHQDPSQSQFGTSFYEAPPLFWLPFVWSAGGQAWQGNACQLSQPSALVGLGFYTGLRNTQHVAPQKTEVGSTNMTQLFVQQKLATMLNGRWVVPVLRESANFDWDVLPFPQGVAGSRVGIDATGYSISASTAHRQASQALVDFLTSNQAIAAFTTSGLVVPAKQAVAQSAVFLQPGQRPAHSQVFIEAVATGVPTQSHPRWNQMAEVMRLALEPAFNGSQPLPQATQSLCQKLNPLLAATP
jgi:multiple sugar transport system substrate-binding protein